MIVNASDERKSVCNEANPDSEFDSARTEERTRLNKKPKTRTTLYSRQPAVCTPSRDGIVTLTHTAYQSDTITVFLSIALHDHF